MTDKKELFEKLSAEVASLEKELKGHMTAAEIYQSVLDASAMVMKGRVVIDKIVEYTDGIHPIHTKEYKRSIRLDTRPKEERQAKPLPHDVLFGWFGPPVTGGKVDLSSFKGRKVVMVPRPKDFLEINLEGDIIGEVEKDEK